MALLKRLWVSMLTQDTGGSGTEDRIVLIINENGVDKLHHTFPNTSQLDQDQGQADLYEINVKASNIRSENLTNSSIRMAIRGSDFWHPQHVVVWAETTSGAVIPLALERNIRKGVSTDSSEGHISFPLRLIGLLRTDATIRQLLVMMTTADASNAGTNSEIELELTFGGDKIRWLQIMPGDTPQEDLERGQANFYLPNPLSFEGEPQPRRNNLDSVVLRIFGNPDPWLPSSFFLFAFEQSLVKEDEPRPRFMMPLVHIPKWEFGPLSRFTNDGKPSVVLPLVRP
jgi:hypothetical protein